MGVIAKGILRGCQGLFTPVSLRYPLSVFNKNSTLNSTSVFFLRVYFPDSLFTEKERPEVKERERAARSKRQRERDRKKIYVPRDLYGDEYRNQNKTKRNMKQKYRCRLIDVT